LSTVSACSLREVAASGNIPWFQLYFVKDRGFVEQMIETAREAGSEALILTVDLAVPGSRYRDARAAGAGLRRTIQLLARAEWLWDVGIRGRPISLGNLEPIVGSRAPLSDFQAWIHANFDPSVSWKDVEWVRSRWDRPLIIKGVLNADDARAAAASGADGVVVSNHGGRQLDGAISNIAGSYGLRFQSAADVGAALVGAELHGFGREYLSNYPLQIGKVDVAAAAKSAGEILDPKGRHPSPIGWCFDRKGQIQNSWLKT
jgi:hypothetical protein